MIDVNLKTNVMRVLEQNGIAYERHTYDTEVALSGQDVAAIVGKKEYELFKTLVTSGKSGKYYVFVIPCSSELNLRKAAAAVGEKNIEMIRSRDLLPVTGYIHGGCSPIGMKKQFVTVMDESATILDTITMSAGKIGYQVELAPSDLEKIIPMTYADLCD